MMVEAFNKPKLVILPKTDEQGGCRLFVKSGDAFYEAGIEKSDLRPVLEFLYQLADSQGIHVKLPRES